MPTIDYLPIANGGGANVESQAQYVTDLAGGGALEHGYEAGLAKSVQFNKTMRQSSMMAAAIANFVSQVLGIDVLDDGVVATLTSNFSKAVRAAAPIFIADTGTANAMVITLPQVPANLAALTGVQINIKKGASSNTAATTLAVNGLAATAIHRPDGSALIGAELPANRVRSVVFDGTSFQMLEPAPASNAVVQAGTDTGSLVTPAGLASFAKSAALTGYSTLPGGIILQWGQSTVTGGLAQDFTLPVTFPNSAWIVVCSLETGVGTVFSAVATLLTTSTIRLNQNDTGNARLIDWIAIGN